MGIDDQKKAVIIGGSNGIGLAIAKELYRKGYYIYILDKIEPQTEYFKEGQYEYIYSNLLDMDEGIMQKLSSDKSISFLMITAGFGRAAAFEYLHPVEISNIIQVNTTAGIKIISYFYERISAKEPFYCGVMGSIAGLMSSPLFSVYAASKAAICRFVESVNIELEEKGTENRILNVSPASIAGTKFNGGDNNLEIIKELAQSIIDKVINREELFIPQYNEIYKRVLERYYKDSHEYGIYSYNYKMNSGRVCNERRVKIGYLSGTFDLFHVGHLNLLRRAKQQCDYLIVGVHNSGKWKGKETFIPLEERKQIVAACRYVDKVVDSCQEDCDAWKLYHYDLLFVGDDYKGTERFNRYEKFFKDKGVQIIYFPYTKSTSSSQIRNKITEKHSMLTSKGKYN